MTKVTAVNVFSTIYTKTHQLQQLMREIEDTSQVRARLHPHLHTLTISIPDLLSIVNNHDPALHSWEKRVLSISAPATELDLILRQSMSNYIRLRDELIELSATTLTTEQTCFTK